GGKEKVIETNAQGEPVVERINKANLDYLSVNTTLDIKFPVKDQLFPFISIGTRFDYLINHSQEFDGLKELDEQSQFSYGFILGGGIKYQISKIQFGLRGDYYLNLKKIAEWPAEPENLGGEISDKTIIINLIVGYIIK
ncbi:MAG: outer membrane beta-barrel protein, partial [Bacteroidales bacterium]|nr:outer membrane beta-barrel protein [Bacteroidales bacterium]